MLDVCLLGARITARRIGRSHVVGSELEVKFGPLLELVEASF